MAWPTHPLQSASFFDHRFGTIQEYRHLILNRQYTCAFVDGALLQMSFTFRNGKLTRNRLCYYPCPLIFNQADWDPTAIPLLDFLDDLFADEINEVLKAIVEPESSSATIRLRLRGPLRFDFAPDQQAPLHPSSHVHIEGEGVRVPVFGPLSIGHFIRFITRHYYPSIWMTTDALRAWPQALATRCVTIEEEGCLFLDCRS